MFIVYKLTAPNGRAYVGVTKRSMDVRWLNHVRDASAGSLLPLHGAIRKYGAESFRREILTECVDAQELRVAERALIAAHGTYIRTGGGYNCTMGGDGNWGWKPNKSARAKWREQRKGQLKNNPAWLAKMIASRKNGPGPPRSEAHRKNLGAAHKGKTISPQHRASISAFMSMRKWTPEQREKMVGRKRGPMSEEQKAKISASKKGKSPRPLSPAAAAVRSAKISAAHKNKTRSVEQRSKMSAAVKARLSTPEARMEMVKRLEKGAHKRYLPENIERQRKMMMGNKNTLGRKVPQNEIDRRTASLKETVARRKLDARFDRPLWWKEWL